MMNNNGRMDYVKCIGESRYIYVLVYITVPSTLKRYRPLFSPYTTNSTYIHTAFHRIGEAQATGQTIEVSWLSFTYEAKQKEKVVVVVAINKKSLTTIFALHHISLD